MGCSFCPTTVLYRSSPEVVTILGLYRQISANRVSGIKMVSLRWPSRTEFLDPSRYKYVFQRQSAQHFSQTPFSGRGQAHIRTNKQTAEEEDV